jgi:hypothetical protein
MTPDCYIDIELKPGPTSMPAMAKAVWVLHGILRVQPGMFALAFPQMRKGEKRGMGNLVRIFTDSIDKLDQVVRLMKANDRLKGHLIYREPTLVPADFNGPWVEYRRFRLPGTSNRLQEYRQKKLREAEQVPYIVTKSKTTEQVFSLHIDNRPGTKPLICQPDSYGLSSSGRTFAVPQIQARERHMYMA